MKLETAKAVRARFEEVKAIDPTMNVVRIFHLTGMKFGMGNDEVAEALNMTKREVAELSSEFGIEPPRPKGR